MLSTLLSLWRTLSLLVFVAAGALVWHSVGLFQDAAAASRLQPVTKALNSGSPQGVNDTLIFDLSTASIGQDNIMGWKGNEYAIIPAHAPKDSTVVLLLSSSPSHLGPAIDAYLSHQSATVDGQNMNVSSSEGNASKAMMEARALIQVLGDKYRDHLKDSAQRREAVQGVARLRPASEFPLIKGLQGEILTIKATYLPSIEQAIAYALGGVALFLLNAITWIWDRRRKARLDEIEASTPPEAPLV